MEHLVARGWSANASRFALSLIEMEHSQPKLMIMYTLPTVGTFLSAFDPFLVIKEQRAAVKRPENNGGGGSVTCSRALRHATMGRAGIEPAPLWHHDDRCPRWAAADPTNHNLEEVDWIAEISHPDLLAILTLDYK